MEGVTREIRQALRSDLQAAEIADSAEHEVGVGLAVRQTAGRFYGRVGSLDGLLLGGEVGSDEDVEVAHLRIILSMIRFHQSQVQVRSSEHRHAGANPYQPLPSLAMHQGFE